MEIAGLITVVVVALIFNYTNGFHDAANAIATSVSTRALTPRVALAMSAVMNLVGAFLGEGVAKTVGDGIISPPDGAVGLTIVFASLIGAIAWNLLTWYFGLPSSSSHALFGGMVGAALAASSTVHWDGVLNKVVLPMIISAAIGLVLGYFVMVGILWAFRKSNPHRVKRGFRIAQTVSAAGMSLGHGLQDAQKTMGLVVLALTVTGYHSGDSIPWWVTVMCALVLSAGTYAGGWRIMRTLGRKIIELDPPSGFAAEATAASVLYVAAFLFKAPISTTQTITAAICGVGSTRRLSAVRWGLAGNIIVAWLVTMPAAGIVGALAFWASHGILSL